MFGVVNLPAVVEWPQKGLVRAGSGRAFMKKHQVSGVSDHGSSAQGYHCFGSRCAPDNRGFYQRFSFRAASYHGSCSKIKHCRIFEKESVTIL